MSQKGGMQKRVGHSLPFSVTFWLPLISFLVTFLVTFSRFWLPFCGSKTWWEYRPRQNKNPRRHPPGLSPPPSWETPPPEISIKRLGLPQPEKIKIIRTLHQEHRCLTEGFYAPIPDSHRVLSKMWTWSQKHSLSYL